MNPTRSATRGLRHTWTIPLLLAVITMLGLLSALLGEQFCWKVVAWVALMVPVATSIWYARWKRT